MSSHPQIATIAINHQSKAHIQRASFKLVWPQWLRHNWTWSKINLGLAILIGLALTGRLLSGNLLSQQGFILSDYKNQFKVLSDRNRDLAAQSVELTAPTALQARAQALNFVAAGQVDYVLVGEDKEVARK